MVLRNAGGHPVFTAEPGLGCTFERRNGATAAGGDPVAPGPVAFAEFEKAWGSACAAAWDDGQRRPAVLLPDFIWPHLTAMINPVTGEETAVMRVRTFPVQDEAGDDHDDSGCCGNGSCCSGCA